ncbi:hypothetical protein [Ralstonia phage RP13]|nr:hypothetical protein [Ralstonia phage RP13]
MAWSEYAGKQCAGNLLHHLNKVLPCHVVDSVTIVGNGWIEYEHRVLARYTWTEENGVHIPVFKYEGNYAHLNQQGNVTSS